MDILNFFRIVIQAPTATPTVTPFINNTTFPASRFANIGVLVNILSPLLISVAALVFGAMLLYMAYLYITAAGDPDQVAKARNTGLYAFWGIVIVLLAYLLVKIIGFVLGVDIPI